MTKKAGVIGLSFIWPLIICLTTAYSGQAIESGKGGKKGFFEVDCNIAGVSLSLCPADNFVKKEMKAFFGLIKSHKTVCSGEEISLGTTPLKPAPVQAGKYILLIPSQYAWENEGPIEITISPGEKKYFLLKLFTTRANRPEEDHGGGGGGGGGGGSR
ncbi:MAG: hypothetical protein JRF52_07900 [Deltaproteobacteria bacterium]|nr:hypothetical protein [Deltaproteobacteria bacterium]